MPLKPLSRVALHNEEERWKRALRDQISEISSLVEIFISLLVVIGLILSSLDLLMRMGDLLTQHNETFLEFLEHALTLVIGVEFIKMLSKHSPAAALEVLLYAIARYMVLNHSSAVENVLGVMAIGLIFAVRKYLYVPTFGATHADEEKNLIDPH